MVNPRVVGSLVHSDDKSGIHAFSRSGNDDLFGSRSDMFPATLTVDEPSAALEYDGRFEFVPWGLGGVGDLRTFERLSIHDELVSSDRGDLTGPYSMNRVVFSK